MKSVARVLRCDCGFEARAENGDEFVTEVQRHAWEAHAMVLAPDEVLLLAVRAELGNKAPSWQRQVTEHPVGREGSLPAHSPASAVAPPSTPS